MATEMSRAEVVEAIKKDQTQFNVVLSAAGREAHVPMSADEAYGLLDFFGPEYVQWQRRGDDIFFVVTEEQW